MKENVVSVWAGDFESEKEFFEYIRQGYDENGDVLRSGFMDVFGIEYFNVDFQEAVFQENLSATELRQASYADTFVNNIGDISGNCAILLYDYCYSGTVREADSLRFLGTFNYSK